MISIRTSIRPSSMARAPDGMRAPLPESAVMSAQPICRRIVVHGRVQGVFFRDSTRQRASAAGVAGWVCNRADGAVEAVLEGPPDAVQSVLAFLRDGPPQAHVDRVEVDEQEPEGLSGFSVR
jgi:acylphosphatase